MALPAFLSTIPSKRNCSNPFANRSSPSLVQTNLSINCVAISSTSIPALGAAAAALSASSTISARTLRYCASLLLPSGRKIQRCMMSWSPSSSMVRLIRCPNSCMKVVGSASDVAIMSALPSSKNLIAPCIPSDPCCSINFGLERFHVPTLSTDFTCSGFQAIPTWWNSPSP